MMFVGVCFERRILYAILNSIDSEGSIDCIDARPIGIVVVPFVCGVNVGGLLCGTSLESRESIEPVESIESH